MADQDSSSAASKRMRFPLLEIVDWLAILLDHCKPIRVSLLVLAFATIVVGNVDQANELFLIALWADPSSARYLALLSTSAIGGLAVWFTARHAYRLIYPRWPALQDIRAESLRRWIPRLLGALV